MNAAARDNAMDAMMTWFGEEVVESFDCANSFTNCSSNAGGEAVTHKSLDEVDSLMRNGDRFSGDKDDIYYD